MRSGARPTVLLLHGQPGGAHDWQGVVALLDGRVEAIAPDRPGWDGSTPPRGLGGNASVALDALDARGSERAVVVGHSLGAAVAAWLAATHPSRVTAAVLVAPAANLASLYPVDRWLAAPVAGDLAAAALLSAVGLVLGVAPLRRRIAHLERLEEGYLRSAGRAARRPSAWRAYASEQRTLLRDLPELERRLPAIAVPTTILAGGGDRVVPERAVRQLAAQIPGARLVRSAAAGHLMPQRAPELVAEAVLAALDR